jgi:hypothetical protein
MHSALVTQAIDRIACHSGGHYPPVAPLVGEYIFHLDDWQAVHLCIDSHDSGAITSPELLEMCDVYVKTNYRRGYPYDRRVVPFFNCNPVVYRSENRLMQMRHRPPVFDVAFIVRLWGGRFEVDGVEHCLRLLEAVSKTRARKFLLAELVAGDTAGQARRLRQLGIPTTTKRISLKQLWDISSVSRLNVFRLGNHYCMPWRMTDMLALGACIVLDQHPKSCCPIPLRPMHHYFSLDTTTWDEEPVALEHRYDAIPQRIEDILGDPGLMEECRSNAADYYDRWLAPFRVGQQLCNLALKAAAARRAIPGGLPDHNVAVQSVTEVLA